MGSLSLCLVSKQFQEEKVDKNFVVSNLYGSVIKGWWTKGKLCQSHSTRVPNESKLFTTV